MPEIVGAEAYVRVDREFARRWRQPQRALPAAEVAGYCQSLSHGRQAATKCHGLRRGADEEREGDTMNEQVTNVVNVWSGTEGLPPALVLRAEGVAEDALNGYLAACEDWEEGRSSNMSDTLLDILSSAASA